MKKIIASSRYLFIIASISSFFLSALIFVEGAILTIQILIAAFSQPIENAIVKGTAVKSIQVVDYFLFATVFYIVALGLFSLFVDDNLPLPSWLEFHTFDDLKESLIGVVIVALGVFFLGKAVIWEEGNDLFYFGTTIALIIFSLTYFLSVKGGKKPKKS